MLPYFDLTMAEAINFIEQDPELREKKTQMMQAKTYFGISALVDPYKLNAQVEELGEKRCGNYYFGDLGPVSDDLNYIVTDRMEEFAQELREAGFSEESFLRYSLFYKK